MGITGSNTSNISGIFDRFLVSKNFRFKKILKAETTARLEELAKPRRTGGKSDEKEMSDLEKRTQRFVDFDRLMRLAEPRKFREKAVKLVDRKV